MIQRGRPKSELVLTPEERRALLNACRKRKYRAQARRARIVLRCARGETYRTVARAEKVSLRTVAKWRNRFVQLRLRGLADAPRPGAPRKISDAAIGQVIRLTFAGRGAATETVSIRSLAQTCGLSRDAVHRIRRSLGLEPAVSEAVAEPRLPALTGVPLRQPWEVAGLFLHCAGHAVALAGVGADDVSLSLAAVPHGMFPDSSVGLQLDDSATAREQLALLTALARLEAGRNSEATQALDSAFTYWLDRLEVVVPFHVRVRLILHGLSGDRHAQTRRTLGGRRRFELWFIPSHLAWLGRATGWIAASRAGASSLVRELVGFAEDAVTADRPFQWIASPETLAVIAGDRPPDEFRSARLA